MKSVEEIFQSQKIEYFAIVPIEGTDIINPRIMPEDVNSAIVFLIPYRTSYEISNHLAHFSQIKDYHGLAKELFSKIIPELSSIYPQNHFYGFADHSPLNERTISARGGLGCLGKNSLLLNEKYGSYVFIGEILTDAPVENRVLTPLNLCSDCEKCVKACPKNDVCLSELSQKKRKNDEDFLLLKGNNIIWGCDKCQEVCPANNNSALSPFSYFYEEKILHPEDILLMSDEKFKNYSFSYRGRTVIEENIKNIFKKDID